MQKKFPAAMVSILFILGFVFISILMAWPTQLLWNYSLVPAVTFAKPIGFLQAVGLNILTSILFKATLTSTK